MDDRARAVARLVVSPNKRVGYQDEGATFTALPIDALGTTVQGVRVSWSSSNTQKVEIDEAGRARFLQPGLAWVNASVGQVTGTAPVLVRPNHRGQQTDDEWRIDQGRLRLDGSVIGESQSPNDESKSSVASVLGSLLERLAPTALAQMVQTQPISHTISYGASRATGWAHHRALPPSRCRSARCFPKAATSPGPSRLPGLAHEDWPQA